ncbi:MAG: FAD-dependent oxidoreductase [Pirellulaceae bacterium]
MHSDLVVLGGGPGGYAAAFLAADEGLQVTLVESEKRLGGTCYCECIPSTLLHVARVISKSTKCARIGASPTLSPLSMSTKFAARKEKVISTLSGGLAQLAKRAM